MKYLLCLIFFTFSAIPAFATKFVYMELKDRIDHSHFIVVGTVASVQCLDKDNNPLKPFDPCTGPGMTNRMSYEIIVDQVLFKKSDYKGKIAPRQKIPFAFMAKSHWSVPKDSYASEIGQKSIFFLFEKYDGTFLPIHEAFFTYDLKDKKEVLKEIKKYRNKK